jgi:hypothetical protein
VIQPIGVGRCSDADHQAKTKFVIALVSAPVFCSPPLTELGGNTSLFILSCPSWQHLDNLTWIRLHWNSSLMHEQARHDLQSAVPSFYFILNPCAPPIHHLRLSKLPGRSWEVPIFTSSFADCSSDPGLLSCRV